MDVFGPGWDEEKLWKGLGENYKILECSMKAFPTEALTHTHISATLKVMKENHITHEQIEEVKVTTIARACDGEIAGFTSGAALPSTDTADRTCPDFRCISTRTRPVSITKRSAVSSTVSGAPMLVNMF